MSFSPIQRLLRRVPALRYLVMRHAQTIRRRRQEAAWLETQGVLMSLGNITIGWAGINLILNSFFEIYTVHGGTKARKVLPRNFVNKLDYMKEIEKDPIAQPIYIAESRAVRLDLAAMNTRRIALVHGLVSRKGYGPKWNVHIAKEIDDRLHRRNEPRTSQDFHDFAKEVSDMGRRVARLYPPAVRAKS